MLQSFLKWQNYKVWGDNLSIYNLLSLHIDGELVWPYWGRTLVHLGVNQVLGFLHLSELLVDCMFCTDCIDYWLHELYWLYWREIGVTGLWTALQTGIIMEMEGEGVRKDRSHWTAWSQWIVLWTGNKGGVRRDRIHWTAWSCLESKRCEEEEEKVHLKSHAL